MDSSTLKSDTSLRELSLTTGQFACSMVTAAAAWGVTFPGWDDWFPFASCAALTHRRYELFVMYIMHSDNEKV